MSTLITNLPSYEVWVRKEYLTDHTSGHGEFVKGVWVSAKSIPGRAFYFETYLPDYAAMFDKNVEFQRTPSRIRTRFIAVFALIISLITFGTSFLTIQYLNSTYVWKSYCSICRGDCTTITWTCEYFLNGISTT